MIVHSRTHFLERLHRKLLQAANVDRAALECGCVAAADAEVARGAYHATGEADRVV